MEPWQRKQVQAMQLQFVEAQDALVVIEHHERRIAELEADHAEELARVEHLKELLAGTLSATEPEDVDPGSDLPKLSDSDERSGLGSQPAGPGRWKRFSTLVLSGTAGRAATEADKRNAHERATAEDDMATATEELAYIGSELARLRNDLAVLGPAADKLVSARVFLELHVANTRPHRAKRLATLARKQQTLRRELKEIGEAERAGNDALQAVQRLLTDSSLVKRRQSPAAGFPRVPKLEGDLYSSHLTQALDRALTRFEREFNDVRPLQKSMPWPPKPYRSPYRVGRTTPHI